MSVRSLNKVMLIGNLTRDPELRYTPAGTAVCSFGLATNRGWTTEAGEKKEETEFHRIVSWNKLAELCSQLLTKGRKVYVEGRLQTRSWTGQDGTQKTSTEIVIEDMIILDPRRMTEGANVTTSASYANKTTAPVMGDATNQPVPPPPVASTTQPVSTSDVQAEEPKTSTKKTKAKTELEEQPKEDINPDDIPF